MIGPFANETNPSGSARRRKGLAILAIDLQERFFQMGVSPDSLAASLAVAACASSEGRTPAFALAGLIATDMTWFCEVKMMRLYNEKVSSGPSTSADSERTEAERK